MNFTEWKIEFSKKAEAVLKAHADLFNLIGSVEEDMEGLKKDEFVLFCDLESEKIEKAIEQL